MVVNFWVGMRWCARPKMDSTEGTIRAGRLGSLRKARTRRFRATGKLWLLAGSGPDLGWWNDRLGIEPVPNALSEPLELGA